MAKWSAALKTSGLYKDGIVDGSHLESLLEAHRRETASTFGTRRSSRKSLRASAAAASESTCDAKENVSTMLTSIFRSKS